METNNLIEEIKSAALGFWGVLTKNADLTARIDDSLSGVATSFIPFLVVLAANSTGDLPMPADIIAPAPLFVMLHFAILNIAGFVGVHAYLRLRNVTGNFTAYVGAYNWSNLFMTIIALAMALILPPLLSFLLLIVMSLAFYIFAANMLLGVKGADVVLLAAVQLITMMLCGLILLTLGAIIPGIGFTVVLDALPTDLGRG